MIKHTTAIVMVLALTMSGYAQQQVITTEPVNVSETPVVSTEKIIHVSSNQLSMTITVHTYKLNVATNNQTLDQDQGANLPIESSNQQIIDQFSSVSGVTRCTFDQATKTFTIVSSPATDLTAIVNTINQ
jgi:hypothetical protein